MGNLKAAMLPLLLHLSFRRSDDAGRVPPKLAVQTQLKKGTEKQLQLRVSRYLIIPEGAGQGEPGGARATKVYMSAWGCCIAASCCSPLIPAARIKIAAITSSAH